MRRLAVALATLVALAATAPPPAAAAAPAAVTYKPPVDAPVVDAFRPPAQNWNAGNRGLEYATARGSPVGAAAGGEVVFAGPVAGGRHVVVLHDDGLRTSYSFLESISVRRGQKVRQGEELGTANDRFHFGVRAGDAYLDPAKLFGGGPPEIYLVPDQLRRPQSEAQERSGVARLVAGWAVRTWAAGTSAGASAYDWAKGMAADQIGTRLDEVAGAVHYAIESNPSIHVERFLTAAHQWWQQRATCTPAGVAAPKLQERRLAVMVAGLGSKSGGDSSDKVDTAGLGYAKSDVLHYSDLGGTREETAYAATDTTHDIHQAARHLRHLLERLQGQHPGVPIDIIAHSQGGIVARTALTDEVDGADPRLPAVRSLVTLSSPHQGTPVATGLAMLAHTDIGTTVLTDAHHVLPDMVDPLGTSVQQLAEHSGFMRELNSRKLPAGVNATSIGAREDWMVPAGVTRLDGAHNVIVSSPGLWTEHSTMPGAPQTQREIALALAGMAPTCQSLGDALADAAVSDAIRWGETGLGGAAWMGGRRFDKKVDLGFDGAIQRSPVSTPPRRSGR